MKVASLSSVLMGLLIAGCAPGTPAPAATPAASPGLTTAALPTTAAPTTVPEATPGPVTEVLTGGRYAFRPFADKPSFTVVATGPDGWFGYPSWAMDGPPPVRADAPNGIGISFFSANGIYSDPCRWDVLGTGYADVGDVAVGPTVDDLVAALRANTFYTSTAPAPVTIDGYAGQELELQLPAEPEYATCDSESGDADGHVFPFSGAGLYAQGQANRWHLYILDVEGARFIAVILSYEGTPQTDFDLAQSIIETLEIEP